MDSTSWMRRIGAVAVALTVVAVDDCRAQSVVRLMNPSQIVAGPQGDSPPVLQGELSLRQQEPSTNWATALDHRGNQRIGYAYDLASRGAVHSAQQELFAVLRLVAQALDTDRATQAHSHALASAQTALEEANDFVTVGAPGVPSPPLDVIIASHRTRLPQGADTGNLTPLMALQQYFSHATRQFVVAAGGQRVAAEALFGLGRITALKRDHPPIAEPTNSALSEQTLLVYYQAACMVDRQHHRAANELGVSLARFNQWPQAARAFEHSVAQHPELHNCQNLASAYERLGEQELARQAWARCRQLQADLDENPRSSANSPAQAAPAVAWVDLETFTNSGSPVGWDQPLFAEGPRSPSADMAAPTSAGPNGTPQAETVATRSQAASLGESAPVSPLQRFKAVFQQNRSFSQSAE